MIIRQVEITDLDVISQIEIDNFGETIATSKEAIRERIQLIADSFLIAEIDGNFAGYIEGPVIDKMDLSDDLFKSVPSNPSTGGIQAITSLSIAKNYQKQGIGTLLLASFKEIVVKYQRDGILLTCKEELISYYEMNDFKIKGISQSQLGGEKWHIMFWENPQKT
ncbi:GNAT family N-acetyltransferase [Streptococcus zalophi]|uniref:GNAT family N-acetyltransferase n=1 Tax=Streptococcus zalophi TaxID=640031 RepID=A0A934UDK6_9STRE|nr:GNAT family N-acetyltransferase [Streptococcus zalophi]MBJ8349758.1 GNAT family N-acetyltransferase [Streptococcus zalophi]MCR8967896.1 GNAT family N-acetyltransferase [Streptococcus zalophi]